MAAPSVRGRTAPAAGGSATSPAGTQVGDLVLVLTWERAGAGVPTHTLQSGFVQILSHSHDDGSTDGRLSVAYQIATSAGANSYQAYTTSTGSPTWVTGIVVLTAGTFAATATNKGPTASASTTVTGTGAPDPASITLGASRDWLVLAIGAWHHSSSTTITPTAPTNYANLIEVAGSSNLDLGIADRSLTAPASENPGAFGDNITPNGSVSASIGFGSPIVNTTSLTLDAASSGTVVFPRHFYLDTSGSDSNDGLSTGAAWQNISKINSSSFLEGDIISFKCGQTFAGKLAPPSSGNNNNPIIFNSWSTGAKPVLNGASQTCSVDLSGGNRTYLYFDGLDFSGGTGEAGVINHTHHITYNNCIFRDATELGFGAYGDASHAVHHLVITNCIALDNGKSGIYMGSGSETYFPYDCLISDTISHDNGVSDTLDHGIYATGGVEIVRCTAYNNASSGIQANDNSFATVGLRAPYVHECISYANVNGYNHEHLKARFHNNIGYSNTSVNLYVGTLGKRGEIYHNTFVNATGVNGIRFDDTAGSNNIIKNNLVIQDYSVVGAHIPIGCSDATTLCQRDIFDNNGYYYDGNPATPIIDWANFSDWKVFPELPDIHGFFGSPQFVTNYTDLHIKGASPANATGTPVNVSIDYAGVTRSLTTPAIGAYEYVPTQVGTLTVDATGAVTVAGILQLVNTAVAAAMTGLIVVVDATVEAGSGTEHFTAVAASATASVDVQAATQTQLTSAAAAATASIDVATPVQTALTSVDGSAASALTVAAPTQTQLTSVDASAASALTVAASSQTAATSADASATGASAVDAHQTAASGALALDAMAAVVVAGTAQTAVTAVDASAASALTVDAEHTALTGALALDAVAAIAVAVAHEALTSVAAEAASLSGVEAHQTATTSVATSATALSAVDAHQEVLTGALALSSASDAAIAVTSHTALAPVEASAASEVVVTALFASIPVGALALSAAGGIEVDATFETPSADHTTSASLTASSSLAADAQQSASTAAALAATADSAVEAHQSATTSVAASAAASVEASAHSEALTGALALSASTLTAVAAPTATIPSGALALDASASAEVVAQVTHFTGALALAGTVESAVGSPTQTVLTASDLQAAASVTLAQPLLEVFLGSLELAGTGFIAVGGGVQEWQTGAITLEATGTAAVADSKATINVGALAVSGAGEIAADAFRSTTTTLALDGSTAISTTAAQTALTAAQLGGTGASAVDAHQTATTSAALSASSSSTVNASYTIVMGALALAAMATVTVSAPTVDTRIGVDLSGVSSVLLAQPLSNNQTSIAVTAAGLIEALLQRGQMAGALALDALGEIAAAAQHEAHMAVGAGAISLLSVADLMQAVMSGQLVLGAASIIAVDATVGYAELYNASGSQVFIVQLPTRVFSTNLASRVFIIDD